MNYTWDRIDYTTKEFCQGGCFKPLTKGIAYVVVDNVGNELHCGLACAENKTGEALPKDIPNLTMIDVIGSSNSSVSNIEGNVNIVSIKKEALEYLLLRYHFNDCPMIYNKNIDDWFNMRQLLTEDDYRDILNTNNMLKNDERLSTVFLKRLFKLEHQLLLKVKEVPNSKEFMISILQEIHRHMCLTETQKNGIRKWFDEDGINLEAIPLRD